jgi:hypothetical protein
MTNFWIYMIGVCLVVGALVYGGNVLHVSATWLTVFGVAVIGFGLMGAIVKTRQKQSP